MPLADVISRNEWKFRGAERFGADGLKWRFRCPRCGHVATPQDFLQAGTNPDLAAFACIGIIGPGFPADAEGCGKPVGPCDYTAGRILSLTHTTVFDHDGMMVRVFPFDHAERTPDPRQTDGRDLVDDPGG